MFTSRAEHRLLLREDNADLRLTPIGRRLGVVDDDRWRRFEAKRESIEGERDRLDALIIRPEQVEDAIAQAVFGGPLSREYPATELLRRPHVSYRQLAELSAFAAPGLDPAVTEQVEVQVKYDGYIRRQRAEIEKARRYEDLALPEDLDYGEVRGLSNEVRQKLHEHRPQTLGHASRVPGVTPAAISLLLVHLKRLAGGRATELPEADTA